MMCGTHRVVVLSVAREDFLPHPPKPQGPGVHRLFVSLLSSLLPSPPGVLG